MKEALCLTPMSTAYTSFVLVFHIEIVDEFLHLIAIFSPRESHSMWLIVFACPELSNSRCSESEILTWLVCSPCLSYSTTLDCRRGG